MDLPVYNLEKSPWSTTEEKGRREGEGRGEKKTPINVGWLRGWKHLS